MYIFCSSPHWNIDVGQGLRGILFSLSTESLALFDGPGESRVTSGTVSIGEYRQLSRVLGIRELVELRTDEKFGGKAKSLEVLEVSVDLLFGIGLACRKTSWNIDLSD